MPSQEKSHNLSLPGRNCAHEELGCSTGKGSLDKLWSLDDASELVKIAMCYGTTNVRSGWPPGTMQSPNSIETNCKENMPHAGLLSMAITS